MTSAIKHSDYTDRPLQHVTKQLATTLRVSSDRIAELERQNADLFEVTISLRRELSVAVETARLAWRYILVWQVVAVVAVCSLLAVLFI